MSGVSWARNSRKFRRMMARRPFTFQEMSFAAKGLVDDAPRLESSVETFKVTASELTRSGDFESSTSRFFIGNMASRARMKLMSEAERGGNSGLNPPGGTGVTTEGPRNNPS